MNPIVLIPARLASTRLPGKPLVDIAGMPMIVHVMQRALEADLGPVAVATDDQGIADAVFDAGGHAVMTRADHRSGSDRIFEALERLDGDRRHDTVINCQGDLPIIDPTALVKVAEPLRDEAVSIGTLAAEIVEERERDDPNVVKLVGSPVGPDRLKALYFTRSRAPWGDGPLWHHVGLYAYRRIALERFVALPPAALEIRERLEQLRALEAGMRIDAVVIDKVPIGVDAPADLERVRALVQPAALQ